MLGLIAKIRASLEEDKQQRTEAEIIENENVIKFVVNLENEIVALEKELEE